MGFHDNPIVDQYSKASEESVLATRQVFTQKNGFVAREENPDKGVDLDVELIVDSQVSGFKFAVQIKSTNSIKNIHKDGIDHIKYSIETSRLGYLCRRSPGLGLIVVYDEALSVLYYDFVENIYTRLMRAKDNDQWMQNQTVTFHIPLKNILNFESGSYIFEIMKQRFSNFSDMYSMRAGEYDLPTFNHSKDIDPIALLEKYGYLFFNSKNYHIIYHNLTNLSLGKILKNKKVLLLAAITYFQIGKHVEGDYYLIKCESFSDNYGEEEIELLRLTKLSSDFSLGRISRKLYQEKLEEMEGVVKGVLNSIYIGLQLLYVRLLNSEMLDDSNLLEALNGIQTVDDKINHLDMEDDVKFSYMIEVVSFLYHIGLQYFAKHIAQIMLRKQMLNQETPIEERIENASFVLMLTGKPQEYLKQVWEYSLKTDNGYLQSVVLFKQSYMFHSYLFHSLMASLHSSGGIENFKSNYPDDLARNAYSNILKAYNMFFGKSDFYQAYQALSISKEINYLFTLVRGANIDDTQFQQVEKIYETLRKELNLPRTNMVAEDMLVSVMSKKNSGDYDIYSSLTGNDKVKISNWVVRSTGLPVERVDNLIAEIEFMQKAMVAIDTNYFDILQNLMHTKSIETLYHEPPRYTVCCKKCHYQTVESDNLDVLLACLRAEHGYVCF